MHAYFMRNEEKDLDASFSLRSCYQPLFLSTLLPNSNFFINFWRHEIICMILCVSREFI